MALIIRKMLGKMTLNKMKALLTLSTMMQFRMTLNNDFYENDIQQNDSR
jgi:hypothetical protein